MVPSTARSTSSVAAPLPDHLKPLLQSSLDSAKEALSKVLPDVHKVNILEEAEFVQPEGGFEHEQMLQSESPFLLLLRLHVSDLCGHSFREDARLPPAPGHSWRRWHGAELRRACHPAATGGVPCSISRSRSTGERLNTGTSGHLPSHPKIAGAHADFDLQAAEAAVVEMFSEAKRHKPSIIYLPNLMLWANSVSDLVKATFKGLLDAMDPSEPVLLMAVVDGLLKDVPFDIRSWFGFVKSNRVLLEKPSAVSAVHVLIGSARMA